MGYAELLKHPKWQRKRLKIFNRDNFCCKKCGADDMTLHIHHLYYKTELLPWEYPDEALLTLCELCHEKAHFMQWVTNIGIKVLLSLGFAAQDVIEVSSLVRRRLSDNNHAESARRYMADIKLLMCAE
jgi:hypothetical protein